MDLVTVYDCKGANLGKFPVPPGVLLAGYVTGEGDVPWTAEQFAAHPDAIRIDQWPNSTTPGATADWIDVEDRAVPIQGVAIRYEIALNAYHAGTRPGQREPAIYVEQSELTPVANMLVAAGRGATAKLVLTRPMDRQTAQHLLETTGGPFPFVGIQYEFNDLYDVSIVSAEWLNARSGKAVLPPPDTRYTVQIERYQDGFGWVLDAHFNTPPAERYRARVSDGEWSDWQEFRP